MKLVSSKPNQYGISGIHLGVGKLSELIEYDCGSKVNSQKELDLP